jgi:acetylornithine deacetylase/succinyl-diaminopimelate desuccinylase-like protein
MCRLTALFALALGTGFAAMPPDLDRQLAREIYKEMVEIRSGYTTGSTTPVAEMAAARLRAAGFPDSDIFVGGASPKKANLVVRYHGTGSLKPILLLAHTDVVEANRDDWSTDPFQFIEKDGYFYGRGTSDDKAQAAVWIANLIRYKREGFKPERDIIVALTADEEGGGPYNGVIWLLKNKRELIDADLCLNEGGGGVMVSGKKIANNIQVSEKTYADFKLEVHNRGGHSSVPVPDNAIYRLATALERLSRYGFPLKTDEVTRAYFRQMAKVEDGALKDDLVKIADGSPDVSREAMQRVAAISPRWNSMLRTTCVATELAGGHALNALPQLATANVNCRMFPGDTIESVQKALRLAIGDDQVAIRVQGDVGVGLRLPCGRTCSRLLLA